VDDIAIRIAAETGDSKESIESLLNTFSNEAHVTLDLILEYLDSDKRLLEVGAGLCLLSLFLNREGYQITALEPAMGGFGLFEQLKKSLLDHHTDIDLTVLDKPAQSLNPESDGYFDLIYSNNVIEHIPVWPDAMSAMATVLHSDGTMIHSCPNYTVPYEPHYGVPVFRHFPGLSRSLFLPSDANPEIWESLNFICCRDIKNYCKKKMLSAEFKDELLYVSLKRIDDDPVFKERHKGMVTTTASFIMKSGLGALIRRIPASLSTPMIMKISHQKADSGAE